jgi:ABC transporter substrate binding protein
MDALLLTGGVSMVPRRKEIMQFAVEKRLPTITDGLWRGVEIPPLLNYRAPLSVFIRQASVYVDKILWGGAKPGDLPIQLPAKFELVIKLNTAKALGLTIPQSLLARADEIIQ